MTLHYTLPHDEVVLDAAHSDLFFDIDTLGEKNISYEVKLKRTKRLNLSMSFDGSKIDEV